jgi:hypothetical protein
MILVDPCWNGNNIAMMMIMGQQLWKSLWGRVAALPPTLVLFWYLELVSSLSILSVPSSLLSLVCLLSPYPGGVYEEKYRRGHHGNKDRGNWDKHAFYLASYVTTNTQ